MWLGWIARSSRATRLLPIIHPHQIEPIGRCDRAAGGRFWRPGRRRDRRRPAALDPDQQPTIERTWLCRNERAEVTMLTASSLTTSSWSRFFRRPPGIRCRETGEVVLPPLPPRGMHRTLSAAPAPPHMADVEREIGAAITDAIAIMPPLCREPRLERRVRFAESTPIGCGRRCGMGHRKRPARNAWQYRNARPAPAHAHRRRCGPRRTERAAADRLDRVFQRACTEGHCPDLPAAERRAVISDNEFIARIWPAIIFVVMAGRICLATVDCPLPAILFKALGDRWRG